MANAIVQGAQCVNRYLPVDLKGTVGRLHDINTFGAVRRTCQKMYIVNCSLLCCAIWAHAGMQGTSTYIECEKNSKKFCIFVEGRSF